MARWTAQAAVCCYDLHFLLQNWNIKRLKTTLTRRTRKSQ